MKRLPIWLIAVAAVCTFSSCGVTLPRNPTSLLRKHYSGLTVYTTVQIYKFTTYDIRDSLLRGMAQYYTRGLETLSKSAPNENYPPSTKILGLHNILRIDSEDTYDEPGFDAIAWLIIPAFFVLGVLGPIITGGVP